MRKLIFATNNKHKLAEVRDILDSGNGCQSDCELVSLADVGLSGEIPETADTLQGNALQKATWVWERIEHDGATMCFADDTGLEVEALNGAPGVYSARYAGEHCTFDDNINKLLTALDGATNRKARFRTVVCLIENGKPHYFEGIVNGTILTERYGYEGFGYDPIFMPDRFAVSFAEMPAETKNLISHRGLAVRLLADYLKQTYMQKKLV